MLYFIFISFLIINTDLEDTSVLDSFKKLYTKVFSTPDLLMVKAV